MILDNLLEERKISKAALANMIGAQRQNINSLLSNPKLSTLEKVANALDIPMWRLFASESEVQKESGGNTIRCPKCNHEFKVKLEVEKEPTRT